MADAFPTEPTPLNPAVPTPTLGRGEITEARREADGRPPSTGRLRLAELQEILSVAEPAAVLVAPRVLERVIRLVHKLPTMAWHVPHAESCIVARHVLFRCVEQDELEIEPERLLPLTVILLARPSPEDLAGPRETVLLTYWRLLFHASIHLALERQANEGQFEPADIRVRIRQLGPVEFDEIRAVLRQDRRLPATADDRAVYFEFAATYLELQRFAPDLLPAYFPGMREPARVEAVLTRDVAADHLLLMTRLRGAPEPATGPDEERETSEYYRKLMRQAGEDTARGNVVGAALARLRAARVAPVALVQRTRAQAAADLRRLAERLGQALQLRDNETAEWLANLSALLDNADPAGRSPETALLYDLQKICLDHERPIYSLDIPEWVLSAGRRPIKRPLPCQRVVRIVRHLQAAASRVKQVRLAEPERPHLAGLFEKATQAVDERMRNRFRPILTDALHDVGLTPTNALERTAFDKMVEEVLDRIAAYGFLTFGDLRDVISRNQLKLPDLTDPQQFISGDPLLRLDRRLAASLDGVYRPSEFYMRCLERLTALNFGTAAGRLITQYVTVPFGGAFAVVKATALVLGEFHVEVSTLTQIVAWLVSSLFVLGLLHSSTIRHGCRQVASGLWHGAHKLFVELPVRVMPLAMLRRALTSWPAQLCYWYVLKPAAVCGLLWLWMPEAFTTVLGAAGIFLAINFLLNSRVGKAVGEVILGSLVSFYQLLRAGLLPDLFRLIVRVFKQAVDWAEHILFSVDEWLCFRSGDRWPSLVLRATLGLLWAPISYVVRLYMLVLIEPAINPVKMPVSYMAAKLMVAFEPAMIAFGVGLLSPVTGLILANILVWPTVWLSPDAFGFLFWEMKENWYLFRANRARTLTAVPVGPHQETIVQLLRPGFHSGTVPRLFGRLRHAEQQPGSRAVESCRQALREIEHAIQLFVRRELLGLLHQAPQWQSQPLTVGQVALSYNRIGIELQHAAHPGQPVWLELENRATWLVAGFGERGWLSELPADQRDMFLAALVIFYKLAGADLVREQFTSHLPATLTEVDITAQGLMAWPADEQAVLYDLRAPGTVLEPRAMDGSAVGNGPALNAQHIIFARVPISWQQCAASWPDERLRLAISS
ncbi:MAG TPA: hypothetical protein VFA18_13740, partial [Gemmataceae bacterium]|nr:hypothetical protein [Gemmataceae bacterium]